MQQRQLRLGDILDDYCPRERRVTNHAVVAMVGDTVKQTRCTTCDAEHEYKHARVPRPRKKNDAPGALYSQVAAAAPKRVVNQTASPNGGPADETPNEERAPEPVLDDISTTPAVIDAAPPPVLPADDLDESDDEDRDRGQDEGPIHRRLIRASLPRPEGQQPPARPIPEFTIRQPGGGRPNRFRPRHQRGGQGSHGQQFQGGQRHGGNSGNSMRGQRPGGGRPGMKRHGGHGRKRSK
jgi:hypothetical protein